MAKKSKRAKSRKKSHAPRKAKRRVAGFATKKRKSPRKAKSRVNGFTTKKKTMKKSTSGRGFNGILKEAMNVGVAGLGAYGGEYVAPMIPFTAPWAKALSLYAGGVLGKKFGLGALAQGLGTEGAKMLVKSFLPIPGATAGVGRLSAEEVAMIERAAMSDRMNGLTEDTIHGNPIRSAGEVL